MPQEWHKPRSAGIQPEAISDVKIKKPVLKTKSSKTQSVDGVQSTLYNPITTYPVPGFIEDFKSNASTDFRETQFSKLFSECSVEYVDSQFGTVPKGSLLSYQQPCLKDKSKFTRINQDQSLPALPVEVLDPLYCHVLNHHDSKVMEGLEISLHDARQVERDTREQSDNPFWHEVRRRRLTASKFKRICARKKDLHPLVDQLKNKVVQTAAMKYGLEHESDAALCYVDTKCINVYRTGFVINPGCCFIGASPDFLVYDPTRTDPFGLLEIKCPQCPECKDAKCLKSVNGLLKLKKTHEYYYQVQGQLGITGLKWCDFMVCCSDDWHIETIHFDQEFFNDMHAKLSEFFFCYFLSTI